VNTREFGEKDPISALQSALLAGLRVQLRHIRRAQKTQAVKKQGGKRAESVPSADLTEQLGNVTRSATALMAEVRKGGKDMRDAGTKLTSEQRDKAVVEYLRDLPATRRAGVLAGVGVTDE
jgi:hypothetical protein